MASNRSDSGTFRRRLGYYALGVAIGLMALGFFQRGRHAATETQREAAESRETRSAERQSPAETPPESGDHRSNDREGSAAEGSSEQEPGSNPH